MKEISIVMAYYNRTEQLELTLRTIRRQYTDDIEIIIVDDASEPDRAARLVTEHFDMDINLIEVQKSDRTWINPCIPYNIGFGHSTGRLVVIQNPECLHVGNVINWARQYTTPNRYMTFSCYNSVLDEFNVFRSILRQPCSDEEIQERIMRVIKINQHGRVRPITDDEYWFNHPTIHPTQYHFCSVITRDNLFDLGGFDERYANGYCWDDNELLWRVKQKGLEVIIVGPEHGFVVHQWHDKGPLRGACKQWYANKWLYDNVTKESGIYKVGCL